MSWTAGVELRDAELPFEGYGHVCVGGPGPVLMYRLDPGRVRACFDVPLVVVGRLRRGDQPCRRQSVRNRRRCVRLRQGARRQAAQWAAVGFRRRAQYGFGRVALAGDAVGYHPMTAAGMSLGLGDAECVAASPTSRRIAASANRWLGAPTAGLRALPGADPQGRPGAAMRAPFLYGAPTRRAPSHDAHPRVRRNPARAPAGRSRPCCSTSFADLMLRDLLRGWRRMPAAWPAWGGSSGRRVDRALGASAHGPPPLDAGAAALGGFA